MKLPVIKIGLKRIEEMLREDEAGPGIGPKIVEFFKDSRLPPTDDEVHAFAEKIGVAKDEIENEIYTMLHGKLVASEPVKEDENVFAPEELSMGVEVEKEHIGTLKDILTKAKIDPDSELGLNIIDAAIESIARDHLKELKDYYTRLGKMERK